MTDSEIDAFAAQAVAAGLTEAQILGMLKEARTAPLDPAPTPAPPALPQVPSEEMSGDERIRAAGREAIARREQRDDDLAGTRARLNEAGYELAGWTDDQILSEASGLDAYKNADQLALEQKLAHDAELLTNPAAYRAHLLEKDRVQFRQRYFQFSASQRADEAARLGIDLKIYDPPKTFGGLG